MILLNLVGVKDTDPWDLNILPDSDPNLFLIVSGAGSLLGAFTLKAKLAMTKVSLLAAYQLSYHCLFLK